MKPPAYALAGLEILASCSPCAKSKRAAQVFEVLPNGWRIWGSGFNAPPDPMACDGSDACMACCGKICIHAEQMAISAAIENVISRSWRVPQDGVSPLAGMVMIHAKVVDGTIVPGGPPSCWQCSREVLEHQLAGFWLFELPTVAEANAASVYRSEDPMHAELAQWRYYTALEFHAATLKNCGLHDARRR